MDRWKEREKERERATRERERETEKEREKRERRGKTKQDALEFYEASSKVWARKGYRRRSQQRSGLPGEIRSPWGVGGAACCWPRGGEPTGGQGRQWDRERSERAALGAGSPRSRRGERAVSLMQAAAVNGSKPKSSSVSEEPNGMLGRGSTQGRAHRGAKVRVGKERECGRGEAAHVRVMVEGRKGEEIIQGGTGEVHTGRSALLLLLSMMVVVRVGGSGRRRRCTTLLSGEKGGDASQQGDPLREYALRGWSTTRPHVGTKEKAEHKRRRGVACALLLLGQSGKKGWG